MMTHAGVEHDVAAGIDVAVWSAFAVICATAGATAPSRLPIDVLWEHDVTLGLLRDFARETVEVGRACGVAVPDGTVKRVMEFVRTTSPGPTRRGSDLVDGEPMELETLHGTAECPSRRVARG